MRKSGMFQTFLDQVNAGSTCMWGGIDIVHNACEDLCVFLAENLKEIGDQSIYDQEVQWYGADFARVNSWSPMVAREYAADQDPRFLDLPTEVQQALQSLFALVDVLAA